jgi:AsmA protein
MRVLLGIVVILVLLFVVGLSVPFLVDLNQYQEQYRPLIEGALNRKITLQDIRLTVWPRIGARVGGFTVEDDPSFRSGPFASLSSLDVGVKLLPLFGGRIEVEELTLREPVIVILKDAAGNLNISTLGSPTPGAPKPEAVPDEPTPGPLRALALLAVDKVSIDGGKLTYRDESKVPPVEYAVDDLQCLLSSLHLGSTATLHAAADLQPYKLPLRVDGTLGPLAETLDLKDFEFDLMLGRIPVSAKGRAIERTLDLTVSAPLIDTTDIPLALPLTKPLQIKGAHITTRLDYGNTVDAPLLEMLEVKDLGLAVAMGHSIVHVKGHAAHGTGYLTAAAADVRSDDLPVDLPLTKPIALRNVHLNAQVTYPHRGVASPLEWADVTNVAATVLMGPSSADVQGSVKGGIAHLAIASKSLGTADLPFSVPLQQPVVIHGLRASVEITAAEARVRTLVLEVFQGSVKGQGTIGLGSPAPPFRATLLAERLQLHPLADAVGLSPFSISGTGTLNIAVTGRGFRSPQLTKALEGTGTIAIQDGTLEGVNLLHEAAHLLKIAGLSPGAVNATVFSAVHSDATVKQGLMTVRRLSLESHDFQAAGHGTIGFDQRLHLRLNLDLSQSLSRRIAASSTITKMAPSGGRLSVPLLITGTVQHPSYGVDTGALAGHVQEQVKRKAKEAVEDLLEGRTTPEDLKKHGESLLKDLFRK